MLVPGRGGTGLHLVSLCYRAAARTLLLDAFVHHLRPFHHSRPRWLHRSLSTSLAELRPRRRQSSLSHLSTQEGATQAGCGKSNKSGALTDGSVGVQLLLVLYIRSYYLYTVKSCTMETYTFLVLGYKFLSLITQSHLEDTPRLPRVHSLVCTDHWKVCVDNTSKP